MNVVSERVPVFDPRPQITALWPELQAAVEGVLRSGQFIMGPNVKAFEAEIAAYLGVKHAVGLNSGTDALVIGLRALGVQPGDEVITTPWTFFATAEAISLVGATPVFVDIDPVTYNIDPALIEAVVGPRTRAIIPVHLYGQSADIDPIVAVAGRFSLKVLEDVAQAFGGEYRGRPLGTIGDAGAFSFFPTKNLGAVGDAGLIATDDDHVADIARLLRVHGSRRKYNNEVLGYNSRLDELQAAILRVKLPHVKAWNEGRRRVAATYDELLRGIPGLLTPGQAPYAKHVYHQYTVRVLNGRRDEVQQKLAAEGIDTMVYYPTPVHRLPVYRELGYALGESERAAAEVLSLPVWAEIPRDVQERVTGVLQRAQWQAESLEATTAPERRLG